MWLLSLSVVCALRLRGHSPVGLSPYNTPPANYVHEGLDWTQGRCSSREKQSPIEFSEAELLVETNEVFQYRYEKLTSAVELYATPTALVAELNGLGVGGVSLHGKWYQLMNINFHSAAEHVVGGARLPVEMQLVHKHTISDDILIVSLLVTGPSYAQLPVPPTPEPPVPFVNVTTNATNATNGTNGTNASNATNATSMAIATNDTANGTNGTNGTNASLAPIVVIAPTTVAPAGPGAATTGAPAATTPDPLAAQLPELPPLEPGVPFLVNDVNGTWAAPSGDPTLQLLFENPMPIPNTRVRVENVSEATPLDIEPWLDGSFWMYDGSLSSPPCGLGVTWLVRQQQLDASDAQVETVMNAVHAASPQGNARALMPRNGRLVLGAVGMADARDAKVVGVDPNRFAYRSDRNLAARDTTRKALRDLKQAVDHIRGFDAHLEHAAREYAKHLLGAGGALADAAGLPPPSTPEWMAHAASIRDTLVAPYLASNGTNASNGSNATNGTNGTSGTNGTAANGTAAAGAAANGTANGTAANGTR